jgi:hypothetical protein
MGERFVILHHTGYSDEHWDLMLESGDVLLTWRLDRDPTDPATAYPIAAERIGDHRKLYLDYEGSLSGNRGQVRRIDGGALRWLFSGPDGFGLELNGRKLVGRFAVRVEQGRWLLARA